MTQSSYISRPADPLVGRNQFRHLANDHIAIPGYLDAKSRLPVPVLPTNPDWVEMYWRAWEIAWSHLQRPTVSGQLVANYLDPMLNGSLSLADCAFMAQFGVYGRRRFDFIGMLDNFYARQHDDGFICRQIDKQSGTDRFAPFDPDGTGPNILAWAEWRYYRMTGDEDRLARVFWPLLAYHRWCQTNRTWPNGLYWATGASSGLPNQPRVPDSRHHHRHWSWVDAGMQAVVNGRLLEKMARLIKAEDVVPALTEEYTRLIQAINSTHWNAESKFYHDVAPDGRFSPVKSIAAYWGLLDKELIPADRQPLFIQHLRDSWAFNLPHRIPSLSADSDGYNSATGNSWRGAVWSSSNFVVLKGLRAVGQYQLAHNIACNHLQNVCDVYQHTDTFWQNYAPESAEPGDPARSDFVGTTGLTPIAMLLEDVIGLQVDWPLRRVTWTRLLETDAAYGVHNYPLGNEGKLSILGQSSHIIVETDVPFTLNVRDATQSLQAAVAVGKTEINLE